MKIVKQGKVLTSEALNAEMILNENQRKSNEDARNVWEQYDNTKQYIKGNKVAFNGSSYLCKVACKGILPTDINYWMMIASAGAGLENATQLPILDAGDYYTTNDTNSALQEVGQKELETIGYGVLYNSGLEVTAQATPNMTVSVSSGTAYMPNGKRYTVAENTSLAINTADATNPRKDIVYVNSNGLISYLAGTASATPIAPSLPSGGILLAEINVVANATIVSQSNITDSRTIIKSNTDLVGAVNELDTNIGIKTALNTTDKSSLVNAINENVSQLADVTANVKKYGAIGDGNSHPLSEKYLSIEDAKLKYPFATSLDDQLDWCAIQLALNTAWNVLCPKGEYIINRPLVKSRCQRLYGINGTYPVINGSTLERKAFGTVIKKITSDGYMGLQSYSRFNGLTDLSEINAIIIECNTEWDYENIGGSIEKICIVADENIAQELRPIGIYLFRSVSSKYNDINMHNVYIGIDGHDYYKNTFDNINVWNAIDVGIKITATSIKVSNCFVTSARVGYYVTGIYQHLDNCACDGITDIAYWVKDAQGIKITGCGQEMCKGNKLRVENSDSVTIDTCFASGNGTLASLIQPNYTQLGSTLSLPDGEREYTVVVKNISNVVFMNTLYRLDSTKNIAAKQTLVSADSNVQYINTMIGKKDLSYYNFMPNNYNDGLANNGNYVQIKWNDGISDYSIGSMQRWIFDAFMYILGRIYVDGITSDTNQFILKFRNENENTGTATPDIGIVKGTWTNTRKGSLYMPITILSLVNTGQTYQGGIDPSDNCLYFWKEDGSPVTNADIKTLGGANADIRFYGMHLLNLNA